MEFTLKSNTWSDHDYHESISLKMKNWKKKKLLKQHPLPDKSCSFQTAQINAYIFFG